MKAVCCSGVGNLVLDSRAPQRFSHTPSTTLIPLPLPEPGFTLEPPIQGNQDQKRNEQSRRPRKNHRYHRQYQQTVALTPTRIQKHELEYQLPESFLDTMPDLDLWSISVVLCLDQPTNVSDLPKIAVEFPQSNATVFAASGNMWHVLGRIREHNCHRTRYKLSIPLRVYPTLTRFLPLPLRVPHACPIPFWRGGSKVFFNGPMVVRIQQTHGYIKSCHVICDAPVPEKTKQWFSTCETLFYTNALDLCSHVTDPECFEVWTVPQTQPFPPKEPLLLSLSSNHVSSSNGALVTKEIYHCPDIPLHVAMTGIQLPALDTDAPCVRSWFYLPPVGSKMCCFQGCFQVHKSQLQPKTILDNLQHMNQLSREMQIFTIDPTPQPNQSTILTQPTWTQPTDVSPLMIGV